MDINLKIDEKYSDSHDFIEEVLREVIIKAQLDMLDITTLRNIEIPNIYEKRVSEFNDQNGQPVKVSEGGVGIALMNIDESKSEVAYTIIYNFALLGTLIVDYHEMSDDEKSSYKLKDLKNYNFVFNNLYHELVHVHDGSQLLEITKNYHISDEFFRSSLYSTSKHLWSEYNAHRKAYEAYPFDFNVSYIKDEIQQLESSAKKYSTEEVDLTYRDLSNIIIKVVRNIGNAHGSVNEREDIEMIRSEIEGTIIHDYFYPLEIILKKMYDRYPKWENYDTFYDLTYFIKIVWSTMGFKIDEEYQMFIFEDK